MDQQENVYSELNLKKNRRSESEIKKFKVIYIWPETKWANHEQAEIFWREKWKAALTSVALDGEDLWLGVKG